MTNHLRLVVVLLTIALIPVRLSAQALSAEELRAYTHFLTRLADPGVPADVVERRLRHVAQSFHLTSSELSALKTMALQYRTTLAALVSQEQTLLGGKATLPKESEVLQNSLLQQRDDAIRTLVPGYLTAVRPDTVARFKALAHLYK